MNTNTIIIIAIVAFFVLGKRKNKIHFSNRKDSIISDDLEIMETDLEMEIDKETNEFQLPPINVLSEDDITAIQEFMQNIR
jgi:hypothetical protein